MGFEYFTVPFDGNPDLPLIYLWEIEDASGAIFYRYVGKTERGAKKRIAEYRRHVETILSGSVDEEEYREVHRQLAYAVRNGLRIHFRVICNVLEGEDIYAVERRYQLEYRCGLYGSLCSGDEKQEALRLLMHASVQDIQLELIRRTTHNALDGARVVRSLLAHRELWQAVMLDRIAFSRPGKLPSAGLIKLRDLPEGYWNADTLYVLTPTKKAAKELAQLIEAEDWGGMVSVHTEPEDVESALGSGREKRAVVKVWWD
jgi:hypothetical protein